MAQFSKENDNYCILQLLEHALIFLKVYKSKAIWFREPTKERIAANPQALLELVHRFGKALQYSQSAEIGLSHVHGKKSSKNTNLS